MELRLLVVEVAEVPIPLTDRPEVRVLPALLEVWPEVQYLALTMEVVEEPELSEVPQVLDALDTGTEAPTT